METQNLVAQLNNIILNQQNADDAANELLELMDEYKKIICFDSVLIEVYRLLNIWSRTELDAPKYIENVKSLLTVEEKPMRYFEIAYNLAGSITVPGETLQQAKENLKNGDAVSSYDLFEGVVLNFIDNGNDAISIDDGYETDGPTDEPAYAVVTYTIICGETHITKKALVPKEKGVDIDQAIHQHFQNYWGEEETHCGDTGYRYNRPDWQEAINIGTKTYVSSFEAEILRRYL